MYWKSRSSSPTPPGPADGRVPTSLTLKFPRQLINDGRKEGQSYASKVISLTASGYASRRRKSYVAGCVRELKGEARLPVRTESGWLGVLDVKFAKKEFTVT